MNATSNGNTMTTEERSRAVPTVKVTKNVAARRKTTYMYYNWIRTVSFRILSLKSVFIYGQTDWLLSIVDIQRAPCPLIFFISLVSY
ncbi:unnamed protein product [Acanthoscelides obtectus]|uniref:Uncharacterized protein n=1 Tax=Acanthoscelides obtectus TaxID=200917 RepID=A0A9P0KMH9_ACAOB|nr:unnamed protein product [Acanthoscelides obtectus]CAK1647134.1 hypothetical protein AOBTE_LOCUS15065 [Acanthoscelides obtectus]